MLCMIDRLRTLGKHFKLHYAVRVRTEALLAHIDEADDRVHLHVDSEEDGRLLDIAAIVAAAAPDRRGPPRCRTQRPGHLLRQRAPSLMQKGRLFCFSEAMNL